MPCLCTEAWREKSWVTGRSVIFIAAGILANLRNLEISLTIENDTLQLCQGIFLSLLWFSAVIYIHPGTPMWLLERLSFLCQTKIPILLVKGSRFCSIGPDCAVWGFCAGFYFKSSLFYQLKDPFLNNKDRRCVAARWDVLNIFCKSCWVPQPCIFLT